MHFSSNDSTTVVRPLEPEDSKAWCDYLLQMCSNEVLYHRLEWDQVFGQYRLPVVRLMAWQSKRVVGILPLVWQRSWIFGSRLVSLPWFDTAGVLAGEEAVQQDLVAAAVQLAQFRSAGLLLRQRRRVHHWQEERSDKVLMRLPLSSDSEELWQGFPPKVRNQVRKAEKSGLSAATEGSDSLRAFYSVYSRNMRDLGSPSHSQCFFGAVLQAFGPDAQLQVVRLGDQVVGAGLTLANGDCMEIPWASSLREFNSLCVNHLLYWHILRQACCGGYRWFHFGRSSVGSGTYHFKKQWGAEPEPLYWYQFGPGAGDLGSSKGLQERYDWAAKIWRKMPLWVTRRLGPKLIANLP